LTPQGGKETAVADELTSEDLTLLIEALEAWEARDLAGEMIGSLMVRILGGRTKEERASLDKMMADEKASKEGQKQRDKERSTMLQAKLIRLKDRIAVEHLAGGQK
jgi:hypothetical protein